MCWCLYKIQPQNVSVQAQQELPRRRRRSSRGRSLRESPCLHWLWHAKAAVRGGFQGPVSDDGWVWPCCLGNRQESAEHRCFKAAKLIFRGNVLAGPLVECLKSQYNCKARVNFMEYTLLKPPELKFWRHGIQGYEAFSKKIHHAWVKRCTARRGTLKIHTCCHPSSVKEELCVSPICFN